MSINSGTVDHWLEATRLSVTEVLASVLETEEVSVDEVAELPTGDRYGAFVSITGRDLCVQVGLAMNWVDCEKLTRAMFQMEDDSEDIEYDEVIDALGEMVNIIGGNIKRRALDADYGVELGLPLHFQGRLVVSGRQCLSVMHATVDGVAFDVALIMGDQSLYYSTRNGERVQAER